MFHHLKLKEHKAISELKLKGLGYLNVICGKNNSGKTSILEAITLDQKCAVGKEVRDEEWLVELFKPLCKDFSRPSPIESENWFRNFVRKVIQKQEIWFSDEIGKIEQEINADLSNHPIMGKFSSSLFKFQPLLNTFFEKSIKSFQPVLLPPKRHLESVVGIDFNQKIGAQGTGLTNRLFFLKNQDTQSHDRKIYEKISQAFFSITSHNFKITPNQENQITIYFNTNRGGWIESNACGLGLSNVLVMICFAIDFEHTIILIEEPESHLHPEMQKALLFFLGKIKSKQFIFSIHSSVFLNPYIADKIFYSALNGHIQVSDETSKSEILFNLGYSVTDNILSDLVVLTEGPSDIPIISTILEWLEVLDRFNIKFWPLGGDIMADLDLSIFAEKQNVVALIDSDPGSSVIRTRFENNCKEHGITCHRLRSYSIENYFTVSAIRKSFPKLIPAKLQAFNPNKSVDEQLGFVGPQGKTRTVKSKNHQIIKNMVWNDIEKTDLGKFCLGIKSLLEKDNANSNVSVQADDLDRA